MLAHCLTSLVWLLSAYPFVGLSTLFVPAAHCKSFLVVACRTYYIQLVIASHMLLNHAMPAMPTYAACVCTTNASNLFSLVAEQNCVWARSLRKCIQPATSSNGTTTQPKNHYRGLSGAVPFGDVLEVQIDFPASFRVGSTFAQEELHLLEMSYNRACNTKPVLQLPAALT